MIADGGTIVAERDGIVRGTTELNHCRYFKNALTLKWKSENVQLWGRGYAFVSTETERLWIPSRLLEIRFDLGRHLKNSG